MQKDQIRSVSNRNSVSVVIDGISTRNFSSFLEMHRPRSTSLYCHVCGSLYFFISIFSNIYIKYNKRKRESKRTHRFSVTLSFTPKRSQQRIDASSLILSLIYTQLCYDSIEHFQCQGRLYPHIYQVQYLYLVQSFLLLHRKNLT